MSKNGSSLVPPSNSLAPPHLNISQNLTLTNWDPPTFTRAAQFRVGATFVLFLFAACSNLALLASVWCGRGQRLSSHLRPLMLSLVSADLMMTFVVMPLDAVWNVTVQWYGGDMLCKLLCFLKLFAMHASAFILVVISLDRQHAILHPLDALSAHHRNRYMLLLAWSLSLLLASPQLFIFRTIKVDSMNFTQCASHGSFRHRWQETVYNMFHFITLYVVPLLMMSCCYSRILLHINQQQLQDKEMWLNAQTPDCTLHLAGFQLLHADRQGKLSCGKTKGGGVCFYINNAWCSDVCNVPDQSGEPTGSLLHYTGESHLRRSGTDIIPKARMKTLKMTVVIVMSFVVCWTPYYLLGIWYWFHPNMLSMTPEYVHHALFVFGNLNTCCDPVIYGFYTPSFRADLAACYRQSRRHTSPQSLDRLSARQGPHISEEQPADPAQAATD